MTKLPESWAEVEIAEVLAPNENGRPFQQGWSPQCESHPAEAMQWGVLKTTAIQHGEFWAHENKALPASLEPRPQVEVRVGDVLMTCAGPRNRCGVACLVEATPPRLMMSGKMYRFRPQPKALQPKYLAYLIRRRDTQLEIDRMKTGISDSGLNLTHDKFAQLRVPLPPLPEQHRIVQKIEALFSELDAGEASLTRARSQLALYRQSLLKSAFQGKLTADWRAANPDKLEPPETLLSRIRTERDTRYKQALDVWQTSLAEWRAGGEVGRKPGKPSFPRDFRKDLKDIEIALHDLPHGWAWGRLGYCTCGVEYGTSAKSADAGSIPVIRMGNLQRGRIDWADLVFTSDSYEIEKYALIDGDILFNRTNSPELVGKTAIYRGERPALFAGYLVRINQINTIVLAEYVCYFLNSTTAQQHNSPPAR